jgi:hypothetical protein
VHEETDRGGLRVEFAWGVDCWLPKAAVKVGQERADGMVEIEVPEWLRKEKGLPATGAQMEVHLKPPSPDMGHCAPKHDPPAADGPRGDRTPMSKADELI